MGLHIILVALPIILNYNGYVTNWVVNENQVITVRYILLAAGLAESLNGHCGDDVRHSLWMLLLLMLFTRREPPHPNRGVVVGRNLPRSTG